VKVVHPSSCKNNCPACSRICSEKAIIFPKYERSPFNGGLKDDEVIGDSDQAFYAAELRRRLELRKNKVSLLKKDGK
jgi:ferredoxin